MEKKAPMETDPLGDDVELDQAVIAELPHGCKVLSVTSSGKSLWVKTVKILVQLEDGRTAEFFKKGATGAVGANMMKGTFEAEQALYSFIPGLVPRPYAWGTYEADPEIHFYLCEFVEMYDDIPTPRDWAAAVSQLHFNSMGKSPTGQFGFPVSTHLANVPVDNRWNPSWEAFWAQQMKSLFDQEEAIHGPDEALAELRTAYFEKAIPRYLRPLESDGRSIEPCLIHSDLWPGNIKPRVVNDELCMFDACAYWGHNEADLAICRNPRYKIKEPGRQEYHRLVPISEPEGDSDGRNAIYAMKFHVLLSIMYSEDQKHRKILMDELKDLLDMIDAELSGMVETESSGTVVAESSGTVVAESSVMANADLSDTADTESSRMINAESSDTVNVESSGRVNVESYRMNVESSDRVNVESYRMNVESSDRVNVESSDWMNGESSYKFNVEPSDRVTAELLKSEIPTETSQF
ncbi:hypothetical protein VTK56DRAFT_8827 [Thermocarpiscus australiensis]